MKAITVKYFGPTNSRGSRIKASDGDGNTITVSREDALSIDANRDAAAVALCVKMGWHGHNLMSGWSGTTAVYVFDDPANRVIVPAKA